MDSTIALKRLEGYGLRAGEKPPSVHAVEEHMPLAPFLTITTLNEALEHFFSADTPRRS